MKKIKGLIAAPFTAFDSDLNLDLSLVAAQSRFYKENGISGVFISGTTGEGASLTMQEKKDLFKEWSKFKNDNFHIIGFIGGTSVKECQELASYAQECNLDAVAMTSPYYQKPACIEDLAETISEVASHVPQMPIYYYHIPCLTEVRFSMYDLLQEADRTIPSFAGIKYTFEDMMDYQLCLEYKDRKYNIMWGRDEMLLQALSIGADSFIGSTYGYNAPIYHEIMEAFRNGDIKNAAKRQYEACTIITLLKKYGSGCGKAFMKAAGLDLGYCRKPLNTLSEQEYLLFEEDLKNTCFHKYSSKFRITNKY